MKQEDFDWSISNDDIACIKWKDKRINGHQKLPEKGFASNSYSGPVKLKFRRIHTVSEKNRLKNVGHILTNCKSKRRTYRSTRAKPRRTRWMCPNCDVGLCMIAKSNANVTCFEKFHKDWK
ncbi:UNVERIFIED_CONTAM: hypothetical protein NCL1_56184 [Trichonephila clavipes]